MEGRWERGTFGSEVIEEGVNLGDGGSQAELGASSKEGPVEVNITSLEESEEGVYFLVVGNVFYKGNEGVSHGHVVGVGFANKADRRLGVNGAVKGGCKAGVLEEFLGGGELCFR